MLVGRPFHTIIFVCKRQIPGTNKEDWTKERKREPEKTMSIKGRRRQAEAKNNKSIVQARHYHRLRLRLPTSGKFFLIPRFSLPYNSFALLQQLLIIIHLLL